MKFAHIGLLLVCLIVAGCTGCIATADETRKIEKIQADARQEKGPAIKEIKRRLDYYLGKEITIKAFYGDPRRECTGIPFTRSDWMIHDETDAIYASGKRPPAGIEQYSRRDWGTPLRVKGMVQQTDKGVPFIFVKDVKILKE